ncbi:hypothetical protein ACR82Z_03750 [Mycoplasma sp. 6243]|uniref:hypothetical protein n=1 Tax=Mycoplasma sp. 6243 TaxID=3440865 RepID=UPI003EB7D14E
MIFVFFAINSVVDILLVIFNIYIIFYFIFLKRLSTFSIYKMHKLIKINQTITNVIFKKGANSFIKLMKKFYFILLLNIIFCLLAIILNFIFYNIIYDKNRIISNAVNFSENYSNYKFSINYLTYAYIPGAVDIIIPLLLLIFYTLLFKKQTNQIKNLINSFTFSYCNYFIPKPFFENLIQVKKFYFDYHSINKKVNLDIHNHKEQIHNEKERLYIFYFIIWGYHFDQINKGNIIYDDLYSNFITTYQKVFNEDIIYQTSENKNLAI